jgi:hypothetical protein
MAVVLQRLVGTERQGSFFPTFSGVASSYNFYPFRDMKPTDGTAVIAAGLGKAVVEGFEALRFCPAYPEVLPQFSLTKDILRNAQRRCWALDLSRRDVIPGLDADANLVEEDVAKTLMDPSMGAIASTYLPENDRLVEGVRKPGVPLVTFSRILKGQSFPLPAILRGLLDVSSRAMGVPVEIEFAVDLAPGQAQVFHVLQIRPMNVDPVAKGAVVRESLRAEAVVFSPSALGHGRTRAVEDVVVVSKDLDRARTREAAAVLETINAGLRREGRPCILVGPGRWGSQDPWLGIPVAWTQISTARAIVETDFHDLEIEASQGSHFFHNLTAFGVAYFTVHPRTGEGRIDWDWLATRPALAEAMDGHIRHLRLETALEVLVDGSTGMGAIVVAGGGGCHRV